MGYGGCRPLKNKLLHKRFRKINHQFQGLEEEDSRRKAAAGLSECISHRINVTSDRANCFLAVGLSFLFSRSPK